MIIKIDIEDGIDAESVVKALADIDFPNVNVNAASLYKLSRALGNDKTFRLFKSKAGNVFMTVSKAEERKAA